MRETLRMLDFRTPQVEITTLADIPAGTGLGSSGSERGWIGDNPFIFLETQKIQSLGWKLKYSIRDGVLKTIQYLKENEWVFERRNLR